MARVTVRLGRDLWTTVLQLPAVRAELVKQARIIAATATAIATAEEVDTVVSVEEGTRPKGRPYARVTSTNTDQSEWGNEKVRRVRALGRAAGIRAK